MKKGMIFNWINNDFNKKGRYVVKEDFEKFSEMNFLDEKLEPEDKSFVKKLFYAMKKNEFYAGSYDLLGLISGGSAGVGFAIKQAVDFMYNETLMPAPMGDIDLFNGIAMGAIACLGVASAYNGVKGLIYKDNAFTEVAAIILEGLGGKDNVTSIDNCITRLRLEVKDQALVDEKVIKSAGVSGVIRPGKTSVQVVVGTKVQFVADEFKKLCK